MGGSLDRGVVLLAVLLLVLGCGGSDKIGSKGASTSSSSKSDSSPARPDQRGDWEAEARTAVERGVAFLAGAAKDGKWHYKPEAPADLGISALVALAILKAPGEKRALLVQPTLEWLAENQKKEGTDAGAIFDKQLAAYITSAAVLAMGESGNIKYRPVIEKAKEYLRLAQIDESEGKDRSSEDYGGIGYGGSGDVNMSTTHWAIEAAKSAGLKKDDAFYQKALIYLQRSQNRSESNDRTHVMKDGRKVEPGNDGGGIYRPADSKAGVETLGDGRHTLRSYGSMTYALLKSYLLCDLDANDPRVKAAVEWVAKNWELEFHPGMQFREKPEERYEGLFYYYLTLARTLAASERKGVDLVGTRVANWRPELAKKLLSLQGPDGSWINQQFRWWEDSPNLVTAYAVLALEEALSEPGR